MKTTIDTFLPVFPGFYCTIFEPDEEFEIESINNERNAIGLDDLTYDDLEFDYPEYYDRVAKECCDFIEISINDWMPKLKCKVEFDGVHSPRFYNYSNDSINARITVDKTELINVLLDHIEEFETYIEDHYTSRSGFISHHSNDAHQWIKALEDNDNLTHKLGAILDFIMLLITVDPVLEMHYYCADNDAGSTMITVKNWDEVTSK